MYEKNLADKIENYSYMRKFTPEELQDKKEKLANSVIENKRLEAELKAYNQIYKEQMKPIKEKIDVLATHLKEKSELVTESCYVEFNRDLGYATIYNTDGEQVGTRPMSIEEKEQLTISFKKTGTND